MRQRKFAMDTYITLIHELKFREAKIEKKFQGRLIIQNLIFVQGISSFIMNLVYNSMVGIVIIMILYIIILTLRGGSVT